MPDSGPKLVAAIELISPGNKDRPAERRAFATKCVSYLYQGISVIIDDVVTSRRATLHNELLRLMQADSGLEMPPDANLYPVAYRPLRRDQCDEIDLWRVSLVLGQPLFSRTWRAHRDNPGISGTTRDTHFCVPPEHHLLPFSLPARFRRIEPDSQAMGPELEHACCRGGFVEVFRC